MTKGKKKTPVKLPYEIISGKNYDVYVKEDTFKDKKYAYDWARYLRGNRHKVKVVKSSKGYTIYVSRREGWDEE